MKTSEASLIRKFREASPKFSPNSGMALGIGDDAALFIPKKKYETILTCDWFLEGTHFLLDKHPADSVGWKSLARAVSDIAAMAGQPRCFLLGLALPEDLTGRWLDQFLGGLRRASRKLHCPLAGGDTTRQQNVLINITVVGEVRQNQAMLRSNASPGDILYVSGHLGEAELGLRLWSAATRRRFYGRAKATRARASADFRPAKSSLQFQSPNPGAANVDLALKKHLYPEPRLGLAQWLTKNRLASAMMDLSDGLSTDLPRLCAASKVGATLDSNKIPKVSIPKWDRAKPLDSLDLALNGGDDYELLFTVRPTKASCIPRSHQGIPLTAIGKITGNRAILLTQPNRRTKLLRPAGWDPFKVLSNDRC